MDDSARTRAVLQTTRSIALDYAVIGLRCNCVRPGVTDSPMLRYHPSKTPDPEATLRDRLRRVPTGVALTPDDIAKAVVSLSCEDSSGITGTSLVVDGGYLAAAGVEGHRFLFGTPDGRQLCRAAPSLRSVERLRDFFAAPTSGSVTSSPLRRAAP